MRRCPNKPLGHNLEDHVCLSVRVGVSECAACSLHPEVESRRL